MNDLYNNPIGHWVIVVVAMALLLFVVLTATAYTVWFERVGLGRIQRRPGPNRVGPAGLLQLAADGIKLAFKESFVPAKTDRIIYVIAPTIGVAAAFLAWSVIPIHWTCMPRSTWPSQKRTLAPPEWELAGQYWGW